MKILTGVTAGVLTGERARISGDIQIERDEYEVATHELKRVLAAVADMHEARMDKLWEGEDE